MVKLFERFTVSVEIKPRTLRGPWNVGFALHIHTVSSTFLGQDSYGHNRFDTTRSPIGELLYQLKYKNDQTAIEPFSRKHSDVLERVAAGH